MIQKLLFFLRGYVRIRIWGKGYERFLNICAKHNLYIWNLLATGDGYEANMTIEGFKSLKPLVKKTGTRVMISTRHGLPFFLHRHRKRKLFGISLCLCIGMLVILSLFVWDIRIVGNQAKSREVILEYLQTEGIAHGTRKTNIDCKELAANLRRQFSDFIWVSVKMNGTRLFVEVQENTDVAIKENEVYEDSDLVSDIDGTIVNMVTRAGVPKVKPKDEIKKGDLLVSGRLEILNDSQEVSAYKYVPADADIYVETIHSYKNTFSMNYKKKVYTGAVKQSSYLKILGHYIGFRHPSCNYEQFDMSTTETQIMLTEDFYLPFSMGKTIVKEYQTEGHIYTEEEAKTRAQKELNQFIEKIQKKGVQIFENSVKINVDKKSCTASGQLILIQKAGKRVVTEKLALPEEGTT